MQMRYVVTAPGRSGTTYVANLLTAAGLQCGHEAVFNRWGADGKTLPDWADAPYMGDSSYIAAPFLADLSRDLSVVHLIRPPLDMIRSVVGIAHVGDMRNPWVRFLDQHCNLSDQPPGPRRAAAYWLRWNKMIEESGTVDLTWRLGQIGHDQVMDLIDLVGLDIPIDPDDVADALVTTPRANARARAEWVTLEDLGPFIDPVVAAAERYGVPIDTGPVSMEEAQAVPTVAAPPYPETSNPAAEVTTVVTVEHTGGGWYDLKDQQGEVLDRVRGRDAAEVRMEELLSE